MNSSVFVGLRPSGFSHFKFVQKQIGTSRQRLCVCYCWGCSVNTPQNILTYSVQETRANKKNLSKSSLDIELLSPEEVLLKHPPSYLPKKITSFGT